MQIVKKVLTKCKISDINISYKSQANVKIKFYKCTNKKERRFRKDMREKMCRRRRDLTERRKL